MVWPVLIVLGCVFAPAATAEDYRLIRPGTVWQYLKGTNEPAVPLGAWRLPGFDDRHWNESPSGFSTTYAPELGYLPDYGFNYRTLYLRRTFHVDQPDSLAELILRVNYDDGFVAYLNGEEIVRRGVAGETNAPLPVQTFAAFHAGGPTEEIGLTNALPMLHAGENLLAVQVFGWNTNDYTFAFVPELLGNFTRGPFLQNTTSNSTQIIFKTRSAVPGFVELGRDINSTARIDLEGSETNHVATLSGLELDTEYQYRIGAKFPGKEVVSDWHWFKTFKPTGAFSFAVLGDSGWGSTAQYQIAQQMREVQPDLIMHLGDVIYYSYSHFAEDFRFFSIYGDQMATTPVFLTLGNHDMYGDRTAPLASFYLPTNNVTGTEHFYSFDNGDVHFTVLWTDLESFSDYHPGSPQYNWLERDLATTGKPWKFLFFHHTWRSSGPHFLGDDYDVNDVLDWQQLDQGPVALARQYGVQIIFNGHDHDYERFTPSGGVLSLVSGGGGAVLYFPRQLHPDSVQYFGRNEFVRVSIEGEQALVEAIGGDGTVFDQMHLRRSAPERRIYNAAWNSPRIEMAPAGSANAFGQKFDLSGEAIGGKVGQYSSSGRLFVNNDNQNIYFGIDEAMLHPGDELFLFIESTRLAGVPSMQRFSNRILPTNSLQTLGSLAFTNFAPAIGVVLGDEWGDGGFISFARTGGTNNTGQGAFYLSDPLPLIAGQRLTQFNRSPEDAAVTYERDANFIKLALPYSAVGAQAGEKIKVGAIVGLRNPSTNAIQSPRELDSGIGSSIAQENGTIYLEGIEVQLEPDRDLDDDGLTDDEEVLHGTDPAKADTDGDGTWDGWEIANGFDPLKPDGNQDADNDGMSNRAEFVAGTDPHSAQSRLNAAIIRKATGLELSWSAVPGRLYKLQVRGGVAGAFKDLTDPTLPRRAAVSIERYALEIDPASQVQYFRVMIVPE